MFSVESLQDYFKEAQPHEPPKNHNILEPFICVNCGEFCKNTLFGQKVMIKKPILFPDMYNYILDYPIDAIYSSEPICLKGEISLP